MLDEVFGAEIHLPEVKGKAITQTEKSDEDESQSSEGSFAIIIHIFLKRLAFKATLIYDCWITKTIRNCR